MFFEIEQGFSFGSVQTLLFPLIVSGNVGQLAADLVINSLVHSGDLQKVGYLNHEAVEPVVGFGAIDKDKELVLSVEVFYSRILEMVIVQQRGSFAYDLAEDEFIADLINWANNDLKVTNVFALFALPAHQRMDRELESPKVLYFSQMNEKNEFIGLIRGREIQEVDCTVEDRIGVDQLLKLNRIIQRLPRIEKFTSFGIYAAEGDNAYDGIYLGESVLDILKLDVAKIPPESWRFAFGSNIDPSSSIYLE
jgi:hypothetical protein